MDVKQSARHRQTIESLLGIESVQITKPFWWESNSGWGKVFDEADWLGMVWQWVQSHRQPGHERDGTLDDLKAAVGAAQRKMLEAKCAVIDDTRVQCFADLEDTEKALVSFGYRREHINGEITLGNWLTLK